MPSPKLIRRHRILALAGAAVVAVPLALTPVLYSGSADAQAPQPTPVAAKLPANFQPPVGSFAPIVKAVKPAVVTVTTVMKNVASNDSGMTPFQPGSPMDQFFRQFFGENGPNGIMPRIPHHKEEALGSGFIINSNGTIVTNNHVIENASSIKVTLDNGKKYDAKVIGADKKTDLAVLKIDAGHPLPTVAWGDSDKLELGDPILAIGNPFGIGTTVTSGIVSARGRDLHNGPYDDFIQVDAAINHGNSGGPLINMEGQVVGINSAIYSPNGGNVGVGFAIPSDQAKQIVAKLIAHGSIERGFIGVQIQPVTQDIANAVGLKNDEGALVASVENGSPADKAGIKVGDVITKFNGEDVKGPRDLARKVASVNPGTSSKITVWRNDKSNQLTVDVGKYKNETAENFNNNNNNNNSGQSSEQGYKLPDLGFSLANITPQTRQAYQLSEGEQGAVIDNVDPDKVAADHGIQEGDVILSVNQQKVTSASEAQKAIKDAESSGRKSVLLLVERNGQQTFVALPFKSA